VAAIDVGVQLMNEISLIWNALGSKIPEMMMRIADGELRLQGGFLG
jgi:hypothetical protein